jgi:uncharacterized repeat protein (TIGR01451 family)
VPVGATLNLSEVLTGTGYTTVLLCNGVVVDTTQSGTTVTGSFDVPDVPNLSCRFGNSRNQTLVVLDKVWGTGSTPGDSVTITLTPPTGAPSSAQNTVGGTGQAGPLTVLVGDTITLSEAFTVGSPSAYSTNLACDNANGTLTYTAGALTGTLSIVAPDAGTLITCHFTNTPLTAQVVLIKALDPVLDPGRFDLSVNDGAAEFAQAGNGDSTPPLAVNVGSTVTLAESPAVDTVAANYSSSLACDNGVVPTAGSFVVPASAAGLTITCTFTNTRLRAQLLITKQWVGPVDPTQAVIAGAASGEELDGQLFVHDGNPATPFAVDVVVGETVRLGERFTANDAANYAKDLQCGTLAVPLEAPVVGDDDSPPGVRAGQLGGPVLDFDANFEIPVDAAGGQVLCTFTNSRNSAQLTLQKSWVDAATGDTAQLSINGLVDGQATATASGVSGTETSTAVATASIYAGEVVTLSELLGAPSGARYAPDLTCTDPARVTYTALATTGTYTVPAVPTDVTCMFTNTRQPPPTITKVVATPPSRNADGTYSVAYDITVANPGVLALDYTLTDAFAFAAGVQVRTVSVSNIDPGSVTVNPAFNGASVTTIAASTLPAGTSHRFRITVTADVSGVRTATALDCTLDPGETGTGFLNRATVNPTADACAPIPDQAVLRLLKSVSPSTIIVDPASGIRPRITYTMSLTNDGPSPAAGVVVADPLPAGLQPVSVTTTAGTCVISGANVTCQIGTLAANATATVTLIVEVPASQAAGAVTNIASVSSATSDPVGETSASSAVVQVQVSPTPPTPPTPLPPTGQSIDETLIAAILLVLTGGALQTIRRRRRHQPV